jgi:uncharacterized membrane protein YhaH (DUF805 family)
MNFVEAVKSGFNNYVNFSGRAQRSAFWWWAVFVIIVDIIVFIVDRVILGGPVLAWIAFLALILPGLAISVRRLHDLDRSGWWLLIVLIPLVGLIVLLIWYCMRGTPAPNQYGPDPLQ